MKAVLITSSILIVLIAALRPILRGKINPRVQYALWLAVVLRLLIPVNVVDSAYSALALLERAGQSAPIAGTIEAIGQTAIPAPNLAPLSDKDAMDLIMKEREQNGQNVTDLSTEETFEAWDQVRDLQGRSTTLATLARKLARPVWLGGGLAVGLWFVLVNLRLRRKLRGALPVEADCPLPVYVTPELPSPCLCRAVRPAVYVTPAALENPDRLRHVLAHELTHCRHRDHWWALARCLCLCVYWFDPLVWWAAALSRHDCELACDEGAIRRLGEGERLAYGRTLVDMIAAGRTPLLQTATTMTGGKRRVRERIQLIARRPRTVIAAALALAVVLALAVGCTFTGAPKATLEPTPESTAEPTQEPSVRPALDTLRWRLVDIPENLGSKVVDRAVFYNDTSLLASYWWEAPVDWVDATLPWLLSVYRWDRARLDAEGYPAPTDTGVPEIFARNEEWYYVVMRPSDARFEMDDLGLFADLYEATWEFAVQTVLNTEGVEPYTGPLPVAPAPTPAPWEADPTRFILDNLDAAFSDGRLSLRVWCTHGSGPASTVVLDSECGQEIRELFSFYDWEVTQQSWPENIPFIGFPVDFYDLNAPYSIGIDTYSDMLVMSPLDYSKDRLYFRADGAEKLSWDIVSLCPDPVVQCALVRCPTQETREGTARLFMDKLFAIMQENGHIMDYELDRFDTLRENPDYPGMITFNVRFRLKITHPEKAVWPELWSSIWVDESGWTNTLKWKVDLVPDESGEIYVFDWLTEFN